jgi:DNA modification methylase
MIAVSKKIMEDKSQSYFVIHGESSEVLKTLPSDTFDTIITDPPYGFSFMGKKWDYDVPSVDLWKECLRVLKPGGTALIFAGARTQHRMACNVEDAGFELKDCIMWLYGSGFPKATDISKQLDKGHERKVIGVKPGHEEFAGRTTKGHIDFKDGTDGFDRPWMHDDEKREAYHQLTAPATPEAELWNGWKSHGLKPAYEPIIVAMKPNEGSYAANALKWGVAGLNIDGGRIELAGDYKSKANGRPSLTGLGDNYDSEQANQADSVGRFPANIIHDGSDEVLACFPDSKGQCGAVKGTEPSHTGDKNSSCYGKYGRIPQPKRNDNEGSAARFFYCAKASKSERNAGCEMLPERVRSEANKMMGESGQMKTGSGNDRTTKFTNFHPTVKPLALMEYLCTLTKTPTGGSVLDPFAGSGTTGVACLNTGREVILIEREAEYIPIIENRLAYWAGKIK